MDTDFNRYTPDPIFDGDIFSDVTIEPQVSSEEEEVIDEPVLENEEVVDEPVETEEEDNEEVADESLVEEEKPVEKVEGIAEVRKAYERTKVREQDLDTQLTAVNQVFEEIGADAKTVAEVIKDYGGIEQLKVGTQIYKLVTDNAGDTESLLRQAKDIIPDTVENLVLYIADEIQKDFAVEYQQKIFGRILTEAEVSDVRDFVDFGTAQKSTVPASMLEDEFGAPLPEKTQQAIKAMWERNSGNDRKIADLTSRIDKKVENIESGAQIRLRDDFMAKAFAPMIEVGQKLGLDKAVQGDERIQAQKDALALEALTYKFFSSNPAADRALKAAMDTLGKTDAASKAKHLDATRNVTKYARVAADTAAQYLAPKTQTKEEKISKGIEQTGAKDRVKAGATVTKGGKQTERDAGDWSDLTVESVTRKIGRKR